MLLGEMNSSIEPNFIKHVAEIYLSKEGENTISAKLSTRCFKKDGYNELVMFLQEQKYKKDVTTLIHKVRDYILNNGVGNVFKDYCFIPRVQKALLDEMKVDKKNFDITKILNDFGEFFNSQSKHNYDVSGGDCVGYLRHSFSLFLSSFSSDVYEEVNKRGTLINGEEGDISLDELLAVSYDDSDSKFSFRKDIKNIYEASKYLFASSARTYSSLYMDIITNYKIFKINEGIDELAKSVIRRFHPKQKKVNYTSLLMNGTYFPSVMIEKPLELIATDYRINTYEVRNDMCILFYKELGQSLNYEIVRDLYNQFYLLDHRALASKNIGNLFNHTGLEQNSKENKDIFTAILYGMLSMRELMRYCEERNIDMLSIPTDVFRTDKYYKRFDSLEDCLMCYNQTSKLIKDVKVDVYSDLMDGDALYENLRARSNFNFLSLKHMIDSVTLDETPAQQIKRFLYECTGLLKQALLAYKELERYAVERYSRTQNSSFRDVMDNVMDEWYCNHKTNPDVELLKRLVQCTSPEYKKRVFNDLDEVDYPMGIYRYLQIKIHVLLHLVTVFSKFDKNGMDNEITEYDLIMLLGEETICPLPETIESEEDLIYIKNDKGLRIDLLVDEFQFSTRTEMSNSYTLILEEYANYVHFANRLVNNKISSFDKVGVSTVYNVRLDENLRNASSVIYASKSTIMNPVLNQLKLICTCRYGYLYRGNKPYMSQGCLLHEKGWLVAPTGTVVRHIDDDFKFSN